MAKFVFTPTSLEGFKYIDNFAVRDNRGWFIKCFEKKSYKDLGIDINLDETFITISKKNVIRALHFQLNSPQTKIITVLRGKVWSVVVDLRPKSATYKQWLSQELSEDSHRALYIPKGFGLGYVSLVENSVVLYQCDGAFDQASDTGIGYNDPVLNINWPINEKDVILSEKDKSLMTFEQYNANPMEV